MGEWDPALTDRWRVCPLDTQVVVIVPVVKAHHELLWLWLATSTEQLSQKLAKAKTTHLRKYQLLIVEVEVLQMDTNVSWMVCGGGKKGRTGRRGRAFL